jgi:hypothetical protein
MPANSEILPKYKSYVGRAFVLRKHKDIPASEDQKAQKRKNFNREETFGDACLVIDEINARVKVTTLNGGYLWISKFYLHKELVGQQFLEHDYVVDLASELLNLRDVFQDIYESNEEARDSFDEAIQVLRQYADKLK